MAIYNIDHAFDTEAMSGSFFIGFKLFRTNLYSNFLNACALISTVILHQKDWGKQNLISISQIEKFLIAIIYGIIHVRGFCYRKEHCIKEYEI